MSAADHKAIVELARATLKHLDPSCSAAVEISQALRNVELTDLLVVDGDFDRDHPQYECLQSSQPGAVCSHDFCKPVAPAGEPDNQLFTGQHDHDHISP